MTLEELKFSMVAERLIMFEGHQGRAAKSLGINPRTLRYIISRIKQDDPALYETLPKYKQFPHQSKGDKYAEEWEKENNYNQKENE